MKSENVGSLACCAEFAVHGHLIRKGEPQTVRLKKFQVDVDRFAVTAGLDKLRF